MQHYPLLTICINENSITLRDVTVADDVATGTVVKFEGRGHRYETVGKISQQDLFGCTPWIDKDFGYHFVTCTFCG
jgi:hypothetical protein